MGIDDVADSLIVKAAVFCLENIFTDKDNAEQTVDSIGPMFEDRLIVAYFPHMYFFDSIAAAYPYYLTKGKLPPFMTKEKHTSNPYYGWLLKKHNPVIVDGEMTKENYQRIMDASKQILEKRLPLIIFPEGTRFHNNAEAIEKGEGKITIGGGFVQLAYETGAKILPVWLERNSARYFYTPCEAISFTEGDFKQRESMRSEIHYWKQFQDKAIEIVKGIYRENLFPA